MDNEITFQVTANEREQIEDLATDYGLDINELTKRIVLAYLKNEFENLDVQSPELSEENVDYLHEFRQSWRDALAGKGVPIDEVWKMLDDE